MSLKNKMEKGISVIICCYNSADRLPETLRHLVLQKALLISWEVIVVNNASSDNTVDVAHHYWDKFQLPDIKFRVVDQPIPGLTNARKKGIEVSRYEYLLFCDDDNWLYPDYIEQAYEIMQSNSRIGVLGGCGVFEPQSPVNQEIKEYTGYYVNGPQTWTKTERWVYGAGSIYRKSILSDLIDNGWQQIMSGRKGKSLISGEDVEICFMISLSGYEIVADNRLLFKHFVPVERQKISYITKLAFWLSYSHVLLNSYFTILNNDKRPMKQIMNQWLISSAKTVIKQTLLLFFQKFKTVDGPDAKKRISWNSNYGTFYSLIKNRRSIINHHEHIKKLLSNADMERNLEITR
jgi:glycosyltransferase involved in cell wall biosynthesis